MHEELNALGFQGVARNQFAGIDNEVQVIRQILALAFEPVLQVFRSCENQDALLVQKAMPSLGADDAGVVFGTLLNNERRRQISRRRLCLCATMSAIWRLWEPSVRMLASSRNRDNGSSDGGLVLV